MSKPKPTPPAWQNVNLPKDAITVTHHPRAGRYEAQWTEVKDCLDWHVKDLIGYGETEGKARLDLIRKTLDSTLNQKAMMDYSDELHRKVLQKSMDRASALEVKLDAAMRERHEAISERDGMGNFAIWLGAVMAVLGILTGVAVMGGFR